VPRPTLNHPKFATVLAEGYNFSSFRRDGRRPDGRLGQAVASRGIFDRIDKIHGNPE
jgi:hypothetical protein